MLAGGGSLLQGLDERLREETQMPAHLAESPLTCVAVGSGRSLEEFEVIHRTNKNSRNRRRGAATSAAARVTPSRLWRISPRVRQDGPPAAGSPRTARRQLPDPPHRLLRRVRRRRAALRPARRARRSSRRSRRARAARSSRCATSSAGSATPSTPRASSRTCARSATRCARRTIQLQAKLREQRPARRPDRAQQAARPRPTTARWRRASSARTPTSGSRRSRSTRARSSGVQRQPGRGQRRGARGQGDLGVARRRRSSRWSPTTRRRSAPRSSESGVKGIVGGRGGPPDRPRAQLAARARTSSAAARPSSPRARCRRSASSPRSIPRGHPDRARDARRRAGQRQPAGPRRAVRQRAPPRPRRGADQGRTCGR